MVSKAAAQWEGNLKEGKSSLTTASNILKQTNYSLKTRFEDGGYFTSDFLLYLNIRQFLL